LGCFVNLMKAISLEQVECTDSVLVENLPPSVTEDILTMYFESSRSGGGPVMSISRTAGGETKITFKDIKCKFINHMERHSVAAPSHTTATTQHCHYTTLPLHTTAITHHFVEAAVPLKTEYESMLYCQEFQDFKKSLDMCCAEITDSAVAIVTLRGLEEDVKGRIIQFLSTPLQKERVLSMEPAMLTYIQLHHQQLLFDMNQLTTILPLESGDGLMVRNASECQMVAEVLGSVVDSTLTKIITVTQPGIARFLVQEEGTSILGEMTAKFQVYISMEKVHWEPLEDQVNTADSAHLSFFNPLFTVSILTYPELSLMNYSRILSVFDHSSEPSSLRETVMEEEEDLYSDPSADQHGDGSQMQAEDSSAAADLSKLSSLNPCSLEEDAELSLAIQLSMETNQRPSELTEDELQKVLELSRSESMVVDESQMLEKAVDVSLQEAAKSANVAEIKVFASYPHDLIRVDIALSKKVGLRHCEEKVEHRSLRKLSAYHKRCIELVKKKHAVEIEIQGTTATVTGFKDYVSEALPDLREVLKRAANTTSDTEILKTIQWVRTEQGSSGPVPYPPEAIVFIENGSEEFQDVISQFYDSIHEYHNRIKIIKVEKLMNKLLYNQYRLKKASVEQSSTQPQVERTLFHGTSETSVKEICVHGFNRSFCGKNATVYGQGVYFAVESALSVSDTYSPQNADGHKFIFVAKVLTGDYTVGRHEMKAAPPKEGSEIAARYHSVTDKIDSPTLFVIFNDTQAFPQYLITCYNVLW
uniref:Poly [ADP-ribose] polymerase n=1 Tax=Astyanax mexicanus TaxID=7994 RepID=A0A8B9RIX1_ASTMX